MTNNELLLVAHHFNADALRIARQIRGFQKNELAKELDVTPSAITQFGNGSVKPTAQTVASLCLALRFPASFFSQRNEVEVVESDHCNFRRLQSSSQSERKRIVGVTSVIGNLMDFLDDNIELPAEQITPFIVDRPNSLGEIEDIADELRQKWLLSFGPIDNMVRLVESRGVVVLRLVDQCKNVDAFSLFFKKRPMIFLNTQKGSASRSRFDTAHELGHLIMHTDCKPGDPDHEDEANYFASAFLLPRRTFSAECPRRLSWPLFIALKVRWKVSLAALVRRARDLGFLSDHTYRRAYVQLNQMGWRQNEPEEPETERPEIFVESFRLLSAEGWTLETVAKTLHVSHEDLCNWVFGEEIEFSNSDDSKWSK